MSTSEQHEPVEQRSSIKVIRNAKGEAQWEVKVVEGSTGADLDALRSIAVTQHQALVRELAA